MQEREYGTAPQEGMPSPTETDWSSDDADFEPVDWDNDEWDAGDAAPKRSKHAPETFGRPTAQGVLAIVAVFAFMALVLVWVRGTETRSQVTALTALVLVLAVILLVEILLMRPVFDTLFRSIPAGLEITPDEDNFIVGCPGCGTVFTVTRESIDQGSFQCTNCDRTGYIKDYSLDTKAIAKEVCRTCGNSYLEYRADSECPVCHTYNPY